MGRKQFFHSLAIKETALSSLKIWKNQEKVLFLEKQILEKIISFN